MNVCTQIKSMSDVGPIVTKDTFNFYNDRKSLVELQVKQICLNQEDLCYMEKIGILEVNLRKLLEHFNIELVLP